MTFLFDVIRGYSRPILLAFILVVGLSLMSDNSSNGVQRSGGFGCSAVTDKSDLNSLLCQLNPKRIWNTPILDLLPESWRGQS